jgi:hypothetical protein
MMRQAVDQEANDGQEEHKENDHDGHDEKRMMS